MDRSIVDTVLARCEARWQLGDKETNAHTEAYRLFHGRGHTYPGLEHVVVGWYPPYLQVALFEPTSEAFVDALCDGLLALRPQAQGIALQHRQGRGTQSSVVRGAVPDEHLVTEHGLSYFVQLLRNQNIGLFLDMGHVREHLAGAFAGARVLNLFAYTCAFSVAAIDAGAKHVVNLDMAKSALELGRRNHEANGQDPRNVTMLPHNLFRSWWKIRQLGPFDVIIIDPPTNQRGSFVAEKSYGQVLKRLPEFASPRARVLTCLNSPFLDSDFLRHQMARWCPACVPLSTLPPHPDFPDRFPERGLKVLEFEYRP